MPKGQPGGNPDIVKAGEKTKYKKGDPRAAENGRKGRNVQTTVLKTVREIATETLNDDNQKILRAVTLRIIKMAAEGNLQAAQYLIKIIGQDPGDLLTVHATGISDEAKAQLDKLLEETKGVIQ